jgi:hypothetical protein
MNTQEIFNFVVKHLIEQGRPSVDGRGNCVYRSPEGSMCAVGCLIPDEIYDESMESQSIYDLVTIQNRNFPDYIADQISILDRLQTCHDFASIEYDATDKTKYLQRLSNRLQIIAESFNLDPSIIYEIPSK